MLGYCGVLGAVTPWYNAFQLRRLGAEKVLRPTTLARLAPTQIALRVAQLGAVVETKAWLPDSPVSTLVAFGLMGVSQSVVYGHNNHKIGQLVGLPVSVSWLRTSLRGMRFGFVRDLISQGVPMVAPKRNYLDLVGWSVGASLVSQGVHNAQTWMQTHHDATYSGTVKAMWTRYGPSALTRGFSGRVGLLLLTNLLNHEFLARHL